MTDIDDDLELERGTGNIFRDLDRPDADLLQLKAYLAAAIIGILDQRRLSVEDAAASTDMTAPDLSRLRHAKLSGITVDAMMAVLRRLDRRVEIAVTVSEGRGLPAERAA